MVRRMDIVLVGNVRVRLERWCSNFFFNSGFVVSLGVVEVVLGLGLLEVGVVGIGLLLRKVGDSVVFGFRRFRNEDK